MAPRFWGATDNNHHRNPLQRCDLCSSGSCGRATAAYEASLSQLGCYTPFPYVT